VTAKSSRPSDACIRRIHLHFQTGADSTIGPHQEKAVLLQKTLRLCEEDHIEMDGRAALGCFVSFTGKASGQRNSITPGATHVTWA
jgi:hypothetical protein